MAIVSHDGFHGIERSPHAHAFLVMREDLARLDSIAVAGAGVSAQPRRSVSVAATLEGLSRFLDCSGLHAPRKDLVEATRTPDGSRKPRLVECLIALTGGVVANHPSGQRAGAAVVRSQHAPFRIEPERGQVSEYTSKPARSEHWAVFHEDESGSNVTNDPLHVEPEPAPLAVDPGALASGADVLARETSRHHVSTASPWSAVKGTDVIPDRERRQGAIVLARNEYVAGVGLSFDGADRAPSMQMSTEDASTSAREKCQLTH
jgi:hypothetical protein